MKNWTNKITTSFLFLKCSDSVILGNLGTFWVHQTVPWCRSYSTYQGLARWRNGWLSANSGIQTFMDQVLIKHLVGSRHCSRSWEGGKDKQSSYSQQTNTLAGDTSTILINTQWTTLLLSRKTIALSTEQCGKHCLVGYSLWLTTPTRSKWTGGVSGTLLRISGLWDKIWRMSRS